MLNLVYSGTPLALAPALPPTHMGIPPLPTAPAHVGTPKPCATLDMCKLIHYVAQISVGMWVVGIRLKCLLVKYLLISCICALRHWHEFGTLQPH